MASERYSCFTPFIIHCETCRAISASLRAAGQSPLKSTIMKIISLFKCHFVGLNMKYPHFNHETNSNVSCCFKSYVRPLEALILSVYIDSHTVDVYTQSYTLQAVPLHHLNLCCVIVVVMLLCCSSVRNASFVFNVILNGFLNLTGTQSFFCPLAV